jgi:hypothetical protein
MSDRVGSRACLNGLACYGRVLGSQLLEHRPQHTSVPLLPVAHERSLAASTERLTDGRRWLTDRFLPAGEVPSSLSAQAW